MDNYTEIKNALSAIAKEVASDSGTSEGVKKAWLTRKRGGVNNSALERYMQGGNGQQGQSSGEHTGNPNNGDNEWVSSRKNDIAPQDEAEFNDWLSKHDVKRDVWEMGIEPGELVDESEVDRSIDKNLDSCSGNNYYEVLEELANVVNNDISNIYSSDVNWGQRNPDTGLYEHASRKPKEYDI